jgi:hypothetical protein
MRKLLTVWCWLVGHRFTRAPKKVWRANLMADGKDLLYFQYCARCTREPRVDPPPAHARGGAWTTQ